MPKRRARRCCASDWPSASRPSSATPIGSVFVTSGTSGGLVLALLAMVDPGDEVIVLDPYFVMYPALVGLVGGKCVLVDTYPDFRVDLDRVRAAITPRTKMILFNSPANPTGVAASLSEIEGIARLAAEHRVLLVSDEIYSRFSYDEPPVSPAKFNPQTLVIDGFSKTYGVTGWRLGFAHGPQEVISQMIKMQQYTFVCAPQPFQWAAARALEVDMQPYIDAYRRKRDFVLAELAADYEIARPGGAFYVFPKAPWGTGSAVRGQGHREPVADHSRQYLQPARHALPRFLRRQRCDPGARRGSAEETSAPERMKAEG